jgi:hypothetical protein
MAEDLLSQLANPDRYAMLKERGAIDEKAIQEAAQQQDRAQNLRQGRPAQPSQPVQQPLQQASVESDPLDNASKHPEQNTLGGFVQSEELVQQQVQEIAAQQSVSSVMPEPAREGPVRSVMPEPPREEPTKAYIPSPPREAPTVSRMSQDEDITKVEALFKKLINDDN